MITKTHLKYAIIAISIAAFFGITLNVKTECIIPVIFTAILSAAYENMHNSIPLIKSIILAAIPAIAGGIIIWLCFIFKSWIG